MKSGGSEKRCQTVGLEDVRHPGKLRKYQCCPVSSSSSKSANDKKSKEKLAKGFALPDAGEDDDLVDEDDLIHDSPDDGSDNDDDSDDSTTDDDDNQPPSTSSYSSSSSSSNPSNPSNQHDDHKHHSSSPSHTQSYVYISDDDFISDAGTEHIASDAFLHHHSHPFNFFFCFNPHLLFRFVWFRTDQLSFFNSPCTEFLK